MPVRGISPVIAPILTKAWRTNQEVMPTTVSCANLSGLFLAILNPFKANNKNKATNTLAPIKPNSSAVIAKIESLAGDGR